MNPSVPTFAGLTSDEWTAIGTCATAVVAAFALYFAGRTFGRDRRRLDDEADRVAKIEAREAKRDDAERRAQAARVYVTFSDQDVPQPEWDVVVHNASDMPIYHVVVGVREYTYSKDLSTGATTEGELVATSRVRDVVGPESSETFEVLGQRMPEHYEVVARFRDASGVNWRVTHFGNLAERLD